MDSERRLQRLRASLQPDEGQQDRVRARVMARTGASNILERAKQEATPAEGLSQIIWHRVLNQIEPRAVAGLFDRLRDLLLPTDEAKLRLRMHLVPRLVPVRAYASFSHRLMQWSAATLILVITLGVTPLLFLAAPPISADSSVLVIPTMGTPQVSVRGLWEAVGGELQLSQGARFQTEHAEATFILNDDGNVRMGQQTQLAIHDVSNRPEPALPGATLTLEHGRIWVQGFVPSGVRGLTIATPKGDITVHEGSVSITVGEVVDVRVWDRHAVISREGERDLVLVAGEHVDLAEPNVLVKRIAAREYDEGWASQNLGRDAVHRREIAQLQMERHAAKAGILPTSPLYSVKRVAEAVDVFLTFDSQGRVEKKLQQASNRLNEASALLAAGSTGAVIALDEYRDTLLSVASGSGQDSVTQFLLRQQVAEDTAQVAAALPDDSLYAIKRAVLEAGIDLPAAGIDRSSVEGTFFLDTLDSVTQAVSQGDVARAQAALVQAGAYLDALQTGTGSLPMEVRKEALSLLTTLAEDLREPTEEPNVEGESAQKEELLLAVSRYLPPPAPVHQPMTEEEAGSIVQNIYDRIFTYKMPRSRWSQLMNELRVLRGHPDEGTILRHLYRALPEQGLAQYVRTAIVNLSEEQRAKGL